MSHRRLLRNLLVPLALLPSALGCGSQEGAAHPPPVLLVTLDTLPADHVGCYGAIDVRTPEMDRLARRGVQVRDAVAPVPLTLPSHCTLLTGLDPPAHGVRTNTQFVLGEVHETVAEMLDGTAAAAAFISAAPLKKSFRLDQGFSVYDDTLYTDGAQDRPSRSAEQVFGAAATWLTELAAGPRAFVWVHAYDPHWPYEAPRPWGSAARTLGGDAYEGEVAYTDRELGRFLRRVEGRTPGTTVVLCADHGEALGRHGEDQHGFFIYDETQRVPLLLAGPGVEPRLDTAQRPLLDVAPTLLAAFGMRRSSLPGVPLAQPSSPDRRAYLESNFPELSHGWSPLRGVRTERWKYVLAPRPELYDLEADPGETVNLHGARPDVTELLAAQLEAFLENEAPLQIVPPDEEALEQLAALGYIQAPGDGEAADPTIDPKDKVPALTVSRLGEQALQEGDLALAERRFLEAVAMDPRAKEALGFLVGICLRTGRAALAVEYATRSLELAPHHSAHEGPVYLALGRAYLALGQPEDAVRPLQVAAAMISKDGSVRALADSVAQAVASP